GAMVYYDVPGPFKPGLEQKIIDAVHQQIGQRFATTVEPNKTGGARPLSPHQSLAALRTKKGLAVDLVAAEPLVASPVAIDFGPDNYQARVTSLQYGRDGWVYGSCGLFGGRITSHLIGKTLNLGDRDFRIKPDTGEIEPATGRTQQGRVRNDWDDWFGCDNS